LNYHIGRIILGSMCFGVSVWLGWSGIRLQASACNTDTTPTQPHRNSKTHRTKNNTTNVVIQQNSRKLLMMDILMSETCWAHKKWNRISSDIKLVFILPVLNCWTRETNCNARLWSSKIITFVRGSRCNHLQWAPQLAFATISCFYTSIFVRKFHGCGIRF